MVINAAPATCPRDLPAPSVSELTAFASTPSAGESSSTLASATATLRASDPTARADDTRSDSDEGSDSDQDADGVEAKARALRKRARDDGDSVVSPIAMNQLTRSRNVAQLRPKKGPGSMNFEKDFKELPMSQISEWVLATTASFTSCHVFSSHSTEIIDRALHTRVTVSNRRCFIVLYARAVLVSVAELCRSVVFQANIRRTRPGGNSDAGPTRSR